MRATSPVWISVAAAFTRDAVRRLRRPKKSSLPQNHAAYLGAPGMEARSLIVGNVSAFGSQVMDDMLIGMELYGENLLP